MCASITADVNESEYNTAIETFVTLFERKGKYDVKIDSFHQEHLRQLAGNVTSRRSNEVQFVNLKKDETMKKFTWVMGDDGLALFLTQSNLQALRSLGIEDQSIRKKLEDGKHYLLCVFYRSDKWIPATWDGVLSLVDYYYSNTISSKIRRHVDALKQMSFDEIETRARLSYLAGASYSDVAQLVIYGNTSDPRFMSEERFSECEGTLEESRGFLYNQIGLKRLFDGSGFTKDSNGQLMVREYLLPNVHIRDDGFRYLNLPIDDTDLMPDV
jgi:hypothetical protein